MLRIYFIVLLSVFLSACSAVSQAEPVSTQSLVLPPSATPSPAPAPTSTQIAPIILTQPTVDPVFFRDDFVAALGADWSWVREDSRYWSLNTTPGSLQMSVGSGYVVARSNSNLLMRPAPAGDFQIETEVTFRPTRNFQFAGLIIYESDQDFVQAGRGYCQAEDCVGEGLYMNYYEKGVAIEPNFGQAYGGIEPLLLRLSRRGDLYTFEASTDGRIWFLLGKHTGRLDPQQVGLIAGQKILGNSRPALFNYFEVRSLQ